jgi:hypothetical protein
MEVKVIVNIYDGAGKVILTMHNQEDIIIEESGEYEIYLDPGDHNVMVYGRPPEGGLLEVLFLQDGVVLGAHTYRKPRSIYFTLEVI